MCGVLSFNNDGDGHGGRGRRGVCVMMCVCTSRSLALFLRHLFFGSPSTGESKATAFRAFFFFFCVYLSVYLSVYLRVYVCMCLYRRGRGRRGRGRARGRRGGLRKFVSVCIQECIYGFMCLYREVCSCVCVRIPLRSCVRHPSSFRHTYCWRHRRRHPVSLLRIVGLAR